MLMNPSLSRLRCLRCSHAVPPGDYPEGCPRCLAAGYPASLACEYEPADMQPMPLPVLAPITLGEGRTPCLDAPSLAHAHGVAQVWLKCESGNPTGSHKDRMAAQLVSRAVLAGAKRLAAASSGNAGVALAAYGAAAGLRVDIAIAPTCPPRQRAAMEHFGARLHSFADSLARWPYVATLCRDEGAFAGTNYLNPPVGTHPYGVEGYKPIAAELAAQCDNLPTDIIVPTARGDLLWGICLGWQALLRRGAIARLPRLHAVEPYPRLAHALAAGDARGVWEQPTAQYSIAGGTVTVQSMQALARSGGQAVDVADEQAARARAALGALGIAAELSSAAALAAVPALKAAGALDAGSRVALILTSDGRRD
ncbi:PLP-dependent lyase/thiolase [Bordetella bronchiseptica]|uniref:PLP-dependent lyase/thiolase n=1 Tax=Bordetella bronchiseptica TaxID=518 RepID=UPI0002901ABF|nr:PLP-dependent lyase/thiolase [Bordetella bronchiseptica]KAK70458.1 pyridoxal-phosphate dependent protein [Bordetella bronchiseptica MO211]KCV49993.1 pyridoxal-phosphate dependent protein [Bordetella bronchiseptica 7E71]QET70987.1 pyridoxal-phosphate dependent enzyme [Bordetella bronchiseptica]RSB99100.1 PLP-dependent lyase/thiolase [Bordetella bronchiseptica]RSC08161.1 PLP-dependent lyase/thiolase [Bordetella bronchiseptica]